MSIAGLSGLRWGLKETKNGRGGLPWLRPVMATASSPAFSVLAFTVLLAFFRSTIRGQKKIQHARLGERFNYRVIPNFTNQNTQCLIKYSEVNLKVVSFRRTHQFFIFACTLPISFGICLSSILNFFFVKLYVLSIDSPWIVDEQGPLGTKFDILFYIMTRLIGEPVRGTNKHL